MHSAFQESFSYKFHQLIFCMDFAADKTIITNSKLNYSEFLVLLAIYEKPQFNQEEIAGWLNLTKSSISKIVDKLVKKQFLHRSESTTDRRQKNIALSVTGQSQFEIAKKLIDGISANLFGVLDAKEVKTLHQILDKIQVSGVPIMYQNLSRVSKDSYFADSGIKPKGSKTKILPHTSKHRGATIE